MNKITPKLKNIYPNTLFLGVNKYKENIYLYAPEWNCDWYWGFGYIGNNNLHTHLNWLSDKKNINLYDVLEEYFPNGWCITTMNDKWTFCEIIKTIYSLRSIAEVYNRGGSHYTNNPCSELIKNKTEYERINTILIPELIDEMYKLLLKHNNN